MSIKLAAIDLDGTTFDNKGHITSENLNAIRRACAQGIFVVPATGRAFYELPQEIMAIDAIRYFVVSNGARVTDRAFATLCEDGIDFETAQRVMEALAPYDVLKELYVDGQPMAEDAKRNRDAFVHYNIHPKYFDVLLESRKGIVNLDSYFINRQPAVEKFNLFFRDLSERAAFMAAMEQMQDRVEVTSSMVNNVEVNRRGVNKGTGLAHLCTVLSIAPDEVLALGDSDNDMAMLRYAGMAVAVANACPALKQVAGCETVSNDENAVAAAFEKFIFTS